MYGIFGILWLAAWIKLLTEIQRPFICAIVYTVPISLSRFLWGETLPQVGLDIVIRLSYTLVWFWLLDRFSESFLYWYIIFLGIIGPGLIVVVPLIREGM